MTSSTKMSKADKVKMSWASFLKKIKTHANHTETPSSESPRRFAGLEITIPVTAGENRLKRYIGLVEDENRYYGVSKIVFEKSIEEDKILKGQLSDDEKKNGTSVLAALVSGKDEVGIKGVVNDAIETMTFLSEKEQASLASKISASWTKKLADFFSEMGLDVKALSIISNEMFGLATPQSYAYFSGLGLEGEDGDVIKARRLEAASHYPSLVNLMAKTHSVRKSIDNSEPLAPALMAASPRTSDNKNVLNKWLLKRLANNPFEKVQPSVETLGVLSTLPPDWFPSTDEQMAACVSILENLTGLYNGDTKLLLNNCNGKWVEHKNAILLAFADDRPPEGFSKDEMAYLDSSIDFKSIQKMSRNGQFAEIRSIAEQISKNLPMTGNMLPELVQDYICRRYAPYDGEGAMESLKEISENILENFSRRCVLPIILYGSETRNPAISMSSMAHIREAGRKMMVEGKSPLVAMRGFRKLHNVENILNIVGCDRVTESVEVTGEENGFYSMTREDISIMKRFHSWNSGGQSWNILSGPFRPFQNDDYCFVPLVSAEDISYESQAMSHCIGDYYVDKSARGLSFNYSLRRKHDDGTVLPMATVEVVPQGNMYVIEQVKGLRNSLSLPTSAMTALNIFQATVVNGLNINSRNIQARKAWESHRMTHSEDDEVVTNSYGVNYNWKNLENIEKVHELFYDFLSKPYKTSLENTLKNPELQKIMLSVNSMLAGKFNEQKKGKNSSPSP